jgi:multicomponent Na+:H+ antiporter subunit D
VNALIAATIIAPLLGAAAGLLTKSNFLRDAVTIAGIGTAAAAAVALLVRVANEGTHVAHVGGWDAELGIVLVADLFAVLVLPVALVIIFVVEIFATGQRRTAWGANPELAGPLLGVLTAGVSLAILTGDLFTLFVAFELILVSSYVLLTHQGRRGQVRAGMTYVVMNLLSSTLFLFGLAFVYAATGTVNIALLAERIPELSDGVRLGIGAWFFVVFGTKAAIFPLFSWLPDSYPTAPTTITAVFAGLLTKIGIYAMIRFHTLTGMDELGPLMLIIAGATMIIGALGALAQSDVKRILSFHIISQIGYMLMGLGLFSAAGTAGAIMFLIHHMPVKTVLFLVGGLIENERGTSNLDRSGGLASRRPWIAVFFAIPALSLAGLPPFSGFVAKFAVISAGIEQAATPIVVIALIAGALTLLSMTKIWLGVFWGAPPEDDGPERDAPGNRTTMLAATGLAVAGTLAISLFAGQVFDLSERAADDLRSSAYTIEVAP